MLPNIPQFAVTMVAIPRPPVCVNVNPCTLRELSHQLRDSGASAIVILENFAMLQEWWTDREHARLRDGRPVGHGAARGPPFAVRHLAKMFHGWLELESAAHHVVHASLEPAAPLRWPVQRI
jgi:acyl-CoA synthetase (AMP-forming)/AMP-acid ligase II